MTGNLLGTYLKDRRGRLDPAAFGFTPTRRRTSGLRREEVAQRAHVSATWYTWLEQGRGGAPSADVLDRLARALLLTPVEREHLFLLGTARPPEAQYQAPERVSPRLQRVLDSLELSPAIVKTSTGDIVAWNHAAATVMTDCGALAPEQRNILRLLFCRPKARENSPCWESVARWAVAVFRADTARAGAVEPAAKLVEELRRASPEFADIWENNDVGAHGEGTKFLHKPGVGPFALDHAAFAVEGRPDLSLVICTPATPADADRIRSLVR